MTKETEDRMRTNMAPHPFSNFTMTEYWMFMLIQLLIIIAGAFAMYYFGR